MLSTQQEKFSASTANQDADYTVCCRKDICEFHLNLCLDCRPGRSRTSVPFPSVRSGGTLTRSTVSWCWGLQTLVYPGSWCTSHSLPAPSSPHRLHSAENGSLLVGTDSELSSSWTFYHASCAGCFLERQPTGLCSDQRCHHHLPHLQARHTEVGQKGQRTPRPGLCAVDVWAASLDATT